MIPLSRKAEIAFHTLQPPDMRQVQTSIEMPDMYPREHLPADKVRKLPDFDDLFMMDADPDIRIIFRMTGAGKEITDIVRYERLKRRHMGENSRRPRPGNPGPGGPGPGAVPRHH